MGKNKNIFGGDMDNGGQVSLGSNGDLNIGLGGGLTIDPSTGQLGEQIAPGFSIDF